MLEVKKLPGFTVPYICSACVDDLFRSEQIDRLAFHRVAGAPDEWLTVFETSLRAGSLVLTGLPADIWGEILANTVDEALPIAERWDAVIQQALLAGTLPPGFPIPPAVAPPPPAPAV